MTLSHDGATLPAFQYDSYSAIKSLTVCLDCPTRYAITLAGDTMRLDEIDGTRVWQCRIYESGYVVCPACLGQLVVYTLNAAYTDDGEIVVLNTDASEQYRNN